jgi:hypothetical protein
MLTQHTIDCLGYKASRQPFLYQEFEGWRVRMEEGCGAAEFALTAIVAPGTFLE